MASPLLALPGAVAGDGIDAPVAAHYGSFNTEQRSLAALRNANETSYFRGADALWVKLVVAEPPSMPIRPLDIQASIAVSREDRGG